jgi:hypothetical protein
MGYLTRDEILEAEDLKRADVPVPEWGGTLLVRGLTGKERDQYEESMIRWQSGNKIGANMTNARARLVSMAAIDEEGKRLFSDRDVRALGEKSGKALDRVFDVVAALSGIGDAEIKELTANFDEGPSGDSGSI